jgi:hypothetical protein
VESLGGRIELVNRDAAAAAPAGLDAIVTLPLARTIGGHGGR